MGVGRPRQGLFKSTRWGLLTLDAMAVVVLVCTALLLLGGEGVSDSVACAEGEAELEGEAEAERAAVPAESEVSDFDRGPAHEVPCAEGLPRHPESFADLAVANSSLLTRTVAPGTRIKSGAYRAALDDRAALDAVGGPWQPYGTPPLISNRTEYDTTLGSTRRGLGDLSGRVNGLARRQRRAPPTRRSPTAASGSRPTSSTGRR